MKKKQKNAYKDEDFLVSASATDCTGLIPSGITEEDEIDFYEDLYPFLPKATSDEDTDSF